MSTLDEILNDFMKSGEVGIEVRDEDQLKVFARLFRVRVKDRKIGKIKFEPLLYRSRDLNDKIVLIVRNGNVFLINRGVETIK